MGRDASDPSRLRRAFGSVRSRWRRHRAAPSLLRGTGPEPTLEHPVGQVATYGQSREPHYARLCALVGEEPRVHRKQWEYVWILRCLEVHGMLRAGRSGLGFGVGREPLVAAIAAHGPRVHATDLEPGDPQAERWIATGQYGGGLAALNERGLCDPALLRERVTFGYADMRSAGEMEGAYDFVWSSCALEHLGSRAAGLAFLRASLERLRPGGVAVHTTEYNVSSAEETVERGPVVLYLRRDLFGLRDELVRRGFGMELNLTLGGAPADRFVSLPPHRSRWHLRVLHERFVTTSVGLVITR